MPLTQGQIDAARTLLEQPADSDDNQAGQHLRFDPGPARRNGQLDRSRRRAPGKKG